MSTISGVTRAWLPDRQRAQAFFDAETDEEKLKQLAYSGSNMIPCGWVEVGTAVITVDVRDTRKLVEEHLEALQKQLAHIKSREDSVRADLEHQITQLQGLLEEGGLL